VISSKNEVQLGTKLSQRTQAHTVGSSAEMSTTDSNNRNNNNQNQDSDNNKRLQDSGDVQKSASQHSLSDNRNFVQSFDANGKQQIAAARASRDADQRPMVGGPRTGGSPNAKRRSHDRGRPATTIVGSSQGSSSDQRQAGTNATFRQGAGAGPATANDNVISKAFLASDNERHKRKLAKARERRATLILGLIMATFICCWLPFFTFYVLRAVCHVCREYIPPRLEAFIFWMGYCNSAMNPIIYTIFNRDFRKAFRKILFRCSRE
jgi:hypothetical protein